MAKVTIRLQVDPTTHRRTVLIDYETDASALPIEHEQAHRDLVEKLISKGVIKAGDLIVDRETAPAPAAPVSAPGEATKEKVSTAR